MSEPIKSELVFQDNHAEWYQVQASEVNTSFAENAGGLKVNLHGEEKVLTVANARTANEHERTFICVDKDGLVTMHDYCPMDRGNGIIDQTELFYHNMFKEELSSVAEGMQKAMNYLDTNLIRLYQTDKGTIFLMNDNDSPTRVVPSYVRNAIEKNMETKNIFVMTNRLGKTLSEVAENADAKASGKHIDFVKE